MKKMEAAPKVKNVSVKESSQVGLRSHTKSPLHSEGGEKHGHFKMGELNQTKHKR